MLNQSPIVLNCFSRGGSNIFWNLFLSHPEVCSPLQETLQIFRIDWRPPRVEGYFVVLLSRQLRLFDQWHLAPRSPLPDRAERYIDRTLYAWKLKTLHDPEMVLKSEAVRYSAEEVQRSRLVLKNNNGLAFLTDVWLDMYPATTFFALVRHPVALFESHRRRGITDSVAQFAHFYRRIMERMIHDERRLAGYHIVRFEDILANPISVMRHVYDAANLDFGAISKVRFKAKPHLVSSGRHKTDFIAGHHYWFDLDEVYELLEPDINEYQIDRVDALERDQLVALTADICHRFGYE